MANILHVVGTLSEQSRKIENFSATTEIHQCLTRWMRGIISGASTSEKSTINPFATLDSESVSLTPEGPMISVKDSNSPTMLG
jgi:hypothetical protein